MTKRSEYAEVYEDLRTALYSHKFFLCRLESVRRQSLVLELLVILFSSGGFLSAVGSFIAVDPRHIVVTVFTALALAVSSLKPLLKLDQKIETLSKLTGEYHSLYAQFCRVTKKIKHEEGLSSAIRETYMYLQSRLEALEIFDPHETKPRLEARLRDEVHRQAPLVSFFWPAESDRDKGAT